MARLGTGEGTLPALVLQPNTVNTNQLVDGAVTLGKILGTDWPGTNASNGYIKLPSGLIVQWGNLNITSGTSTVTFPTAFPTSCFNVLTGSQNGATIVNSSSGSITKTTVGITVGATGGGVTWLAIGY